MTAMTSGAMDFHILSIPKETYRTHNVTRPRTSSAEKPAWWFQQIAMVEQSSFNRGIHGIYGYGSIPTNTIFRGMNIHLPSILMFTRGTRFWHTAISMSHGNNHGIRRAMKNLVFQVQRCQASQLWCPWFSRVNCHFRAVARLFSLKWMVCFMENTIKIWMITRGTPMTLETPKYV